MATLFLLTLILDCVAVMLKSIPGVQVLLFQ